MDTKELLEFNLVIIGIGVTISLTEIIIGKNINFLIYAIIQLAGLYGYRKMVKE